VESRPARPASRLITVAALAVPLCVFPSAGWRLVYVVGAALGPPAACDPRSIGEGIYIVSLSVVSLGAAALTIGLVRPWGEVVPSWIPLVGGRRVAARAVSTVAMAGAALIGLLTLYFLARLALGVERGESPTGCEPPGLEVLVFYLPLLAWAPLLALVASDYRRRMLP
jgi:hypothetical protein